MAFAKFPKPSPRKKGADSTIALINVVFLMLIFFLIAGTLSPPVIGSLDPVTTSEAENSGPPDALSVSADGSLSWRGEPVGIERVPDLLSQRGTEGPLRIFVDRALPAPELVGLLSDLRREGVEDLVLVTERQRN